MIGIKYFSFPHEETKILDKINIIKCISLNVNLSNQSNIVENIL